MVSAIHRVKEKSKKNKFFISKVVLIASTAVLLLAAPFLIYTITYFGKIYPGISVAGMKIGGMSPQSAVFLLSGSTQVPQEITVLSPGQTLNIRAKDLDLSYNFTDSVERAYSLGRSGNIFLDLTTRADLFFHPLNIGLSTNINHEKLSKIISVFSGQISEDPVPPVIKIANGQVEITDGKSGKEVDQDLLAALIGQRFSLLDKNPVDAPINTVDNSLTESQKANAVATAGKLLGKSLTLSFEDKKYDLSDDKLVSFLNPKGGFDDQAVNDLAEKISSDINRDPQNPKFNFDSGKVTEFQPAHDGIKFDQEAFRAALANIFEQIENNDSKTYSLAIPVARTPPEVTTDKVNNLGIKELIGRGTSTYYHSIPSRVYNITLAASRINGTLVAPGDTFSFNDTLGDVSAFTGYQQAYIISGGKTILGDGGGVCQVSTTLFRATINAGLPITERAAHAYRVGYYEQNSPPGLDATVYGPSPDLKFVNNTPGYILVEAQADTRHYSLVFELYGTADGRVATITRPVVTNITPALPTVYQDDPTLPLGTLKQTDFSAAGATVTFNYLVTRSGETIYQKTFISNYRPWAAVYLRGTGPAI